MKSYMAISGNERPGNTNVQMFKLLACYQEQNAFEARVYLILIKALILTKTLSQ